MNPIQTSIKLDPDQTRDALELLHRMAEEMADCDHDFATLVDYQAMFPSEETKMEG
jgi:hypothetical protein